MNMNNDDNDNIIIIPLVWHMIVPYTVAHNDDSYDDILCHMESQLPEAKGWSKGPPAGGQPQSDDRELTGPYLGKGSELNKALGPKVVCCFCCVLFPPMV